MILSQLLANGIVTGCVYALVALGFGLIYSTTRIFHVAHGAVYTAAAYAFYSFSRSLELDPYLSFTLSLVVAVLLGVAMEIVAYRPLFRRGASMGVFLISSLGIYIFVVNAIAMAYGNESKILSPGVQNTFRLGSVVLTRIQVLEVLAFLVIFPAFAVFLRKARLGKLVRALSNNPSLVPVLGVDVRRIRVYAFMIGSLLAGVASCLVALDVGMDPNVGMEVLLIAAVAVIVGGVGIFEGPVIGAFVVGTVQNLSVWKISARWEAAITFFLLVLFMLARPQGILGARKRVEEI